MNQMTNDINYQDMKKILLLKNIYFDAFRNLGNIILRNSFKIYSWLCLALIFIVIYAFIYRLSTGFVF
ncbi:MAG: hypothetical protein COA50_12015 [Flavobacteriaceae bacterium]|nr:MAG: hypothetical protein COA50_12015 [Flavobacteriaceae bacterium]